MWGMSHRSRATRSTAPLSSALVRSLKTGLGLSLYSGIIDTGTRIYNISQGLRKIADALGIQLWE